MLGTNHMWGNGTVHPIILVVSCCVWGDNQGGSWDVSGILRTVWMPVGNTGHPSHSCVLLYMWCVCRSCGYCFWLVHVQSKTLVPCDTQDVRSYANQREIKQNHLHPICWVRDIIEFVVWPGSSHRKLYQNREVLPHSEALELQPSHMQSCHTDT